MDPEVDPSMQQGYRSPGSLLQSEHLPLAEVEVSGHTWGGLPDADAFRLSTPEAADHNAP